MKERERLEQAVQALEAQRPILGDDAVDTSIAALKEKLAAFEPAAPKSRQQRKQITVLFADITGFTAMSESLDAEEVTAIMNALWKRLDAAILESGGAIDKHIGDNVMALWGTDRAREDDPERACRAALDILVEVTKFNRERRTPSPIQVRIGINTGPVLLGEMGSKGEFTAMGDTVNTASRLEGEAPSGGILISHDTLRHVRGIFDVSSMQPLEVKGKKEPLHTYVLEGAKPKAFRMPTRGVEGIETRMVGRNAELEAMQERFREATESSRTRVLTVVGDAGVGKSRLLYEFGKWLDLLPERVNFFKGRATPEMINIPLGIIRDLFSMSFNILESDGFSVMREKFRQGTAGLLEPDRAEVVGQLLGFDFSASETVRGLLGSKSFRQQAMADLTTLIRSVAREPTVIFLEDLHWADDASLDLILDLAEQLPDSKLYVACLARPTLLERRPGWGEDREACSRLNLDLLTPNDCRALVEEILKRVENIPGDLRDLIVDGAEGNPYYVEELIKMLMEDGVILRGEEAWSVETDRLARVQVPPTLTGVLQARLDSLPAEEKQLLQRASVVGRLFWDAAVAELALGEPDGGGKALDTDQINRLLDSIRQRELVFQMNHSIFEEADEYIFKHSILRDVTYETVLLKTRRVYHGQVARWLEANVRERRSEYLSQIAGHFELAGEGEKAADYLIRAGIELQDVSDFKGAVKSFERALSLLPESRKGARSAVLADLADGYRQVGDYPRARDHFEQSLVIARELGIHETQIAAYNGLGRTAVAQGAYGEALPFLNQALSLGRERGHDGGVALALHNLADAHYRLGQTEDAERCALECLEIYRRLGDKQGIAGAHRVMGFVTMMQGNYVDTARHHRESQKIYGEIGDRWGVATGYINLGETYRKQERYEEAVACWKRSLPISEEIHARLSWAISHLNTGNVLAAMGGRDDEAWGHIRSALKESLSMGADPITLEGLVGVTLLKVSAGEDTLATELLGTVTGHGAFNAEIKEYTDPILAALSERMEASDFSGCMERGRDRDMEAVVREILDAGEAR